MPMQAICHDFELSLIVEDLEKYVILASVRVHVCTCMRLEDENVTALGRESTNMFQIGAIPHAVA
eukprot:scaffold355831_cov19-Prasinocladus_malaysianus.AAC.1